MTRLRSNLVFTALLLLVPATGWAQAAGGEADSPPTEQAPSEGATAEGAAEGSGAEGAGAEGAGAEGAGAEGSGEGAAEGGDVPPPPGGTPPEGTDPPAGDVPSPDARRRLIVIDAATYGVDPVVGRHVSQQMRATGAALGYEVLTPEQSVAAAQRLRMPYPPTPANLWRVSYVAEAHRGAFARVWAHAGSYVFEISVASMDGTGPYFARGNSGASDLHSAVDRLLRQALPPPDVWQEQAQAEQGGGTTGTPAEGSGESGEGTTSPGAAAEGGEFAEETPEDEEERRRRRRRRVRRRLHLVLQTEGAIGTSQDSFYNHLLGVRLDYRVSREILFGAYAGYANLRGKDGRASNVLMYLQVEDRVRISSASDITVPLRLGIGYLPFNGPVVRLAAGINIPLSRDIQLGFDILAPTFWVLPDRTAVSLNLAAELIWRL